MEFFKIRRTIPFMRHAKVFNVISAITFVLAVVFLASLLPPWLVWRLRRRLAWAVRVIDWVAGLCADDPHRT